MWMDAAAWVVSLLVLHLLGALDLHAPYVAAVAASVVPSQCAAGLAVGVYRGRFRYGSFEEVAGLLRSAAVATCVLLLVGSALLEEPQSAQVLLLAALPAVGVMTGSRWCVRLGAERRNRPGRLHPVQHLVVFGAGSAGEQVVTALLRDPHSPFLPVAFLDDDPGSRRLRVRGVPVLGTRHDMDDVARRVGATVLLIALPSADASTIGELSALADVAGLAVKVLPAVQDLNPSNVTVRDIRDLDLEDLLGRRPISIDLETVAASLRGRRVLVTGAGGSIGSELCLALAALEPAELIMLDRDESALHAVQLQLHGRAMLDSDETVLADIRDIRAMTEIFEQRRPEIVFHSAALKHLPMLQRYPGEAIQTNVWGTLTVLQVAAATGVRRVVNISTDKAADPVSVLGYSKRMTECLTARMGDLTGVEMVSVRFGNVLASRGSVLTTFAAQAAAGQPLTVTSPDVTRYFMTVQEAVQLLLQASVVGRQGEVLVLDMGEPVRIADVARRVASSVSPAVGILYTGLRAGEKMYEALLGAQEADVRPFHPLVMHVAAPRLDPLRATALDPWAPVEQLISSMAEMCVTPERRVAGRRGARALSPGRAERRSGDRRPPSVFVVPADALVALTA